MNSAGPLDDATIASLLVDADPWLSCDDCFEELDTYAEAVVSDPAHKDPPMQLHLAGCSACSEEAEGLIALLREDARRREGRWVRPSRTR